ncbi:phosphotransferase [Streptomyces sp. NPDC020298]|uniref:phosphotransferase n=1 Tax=unclassified Streptomyces TaxID=2593676 RepID=UPI00340E519C
MEIVHDGGMTESSLPGGLVNHVVRVGSTVRRPASARTGFIGHLLKTFETSGWTGAPRYRGIDEEGREVLTYLEGHVAWEPQQPTAVYSDESLVRVAQLVREFHDVTSGTELAGSHEVVCHNDLSPKNTVYRPVSGALRPVAFIDWDLAAPGERIHDVAHVCWQYLGLGPGVGDTFQTARRLRLIADSYGLIERSDLVSVILWWQDRCWRGIEAAADSGNRAMVRLRDTGAVTEVQEAYQWVSDHRGEMESALR